MAVVTETIQRFLNLYTHKDLSSLYNPGMEVQVMVRPDGGEPTENGKSYTDGLNTWFNFRIPKNARTTPEFKEWELRFPLAEHALAIGMTGWNFVERKSMHVAFDFDAICGTSHQGTGISQEELDRVREAACAIPWVEVRKSTGGGGLHLRVHLGKGVPAANHTEHAALGRAVLGMMSVAAGFDFSDKVDICGGNMWVWHRKMTAENGGLSVIKPREHDLTDIPENWRNHIDVVNRKRRKVRVPGLGDSAQDKLDDLAMTTKSAPLDDKHKALMDWLTVNNWTCVWESDHGMLRTHTAGLAEAHQALGMVGAFRTLATGRDKTDYNCFCFPKPDGGWRVVRYGEGTLEADTWVQDGGWTLCYLNQPPNLKMAALSQGGVADEDGGYVFSSLVAAAEVAKLLGARLEVTGALADRQTKLRPAKDGTGIAVEVKKEKQDTDNDGAGFIAKKGVYKKVINAVLPKFEQQMVNYDSKIRYLLTPAKEPGGWVINLQNDWYAQPKDNVISVLMNLGMSAADAKTATGQIVEDSWVLSSVPFSPVYPGGRRWNKDAAQFRFEPAEEDDLPHPHWDMILNHCGKGINDAVRANAWCRDNAITSGALYLRLWIASMIQNPYEPLPYIFFFSEPYQNCGKSSFHEAINLLMTKGVMRADQALQSTGNFNAELLGAILCVVEETDLSKAGSRVYEKMKDWVTGRQLSIHQKGLTPFQVTNTTHWVQASNLQRACPIFEGDTRVTMIQVYPFSERQEIPWPRLKTRLEEEAPAFLRTILDTAIPDSNGRLRIPVIDTEDKARAIEFNRDELQTFLSERCHYVPGAQIEFAEFYDTFMETLAMSEKVKWSKRKVASALPPKFPRGERHARKVYIGNISFENTPPQPNAVPLIRVGSNLIPEPNENQVGEDECL